MPGAWVLVWIYEKIPEMAGGTNISIPGNATINKLCLNISDIREMLESGKNFDKLKDVTAFFGETFSAMLQRNEQEFVQGLIK